MHKTQNDDSKRQAKSIMSRNVTEFRHLLDKSYINQNDLNWTIGLRNNPKTKKIEHREPVPPEVFFKKTEITTIRDNFKTKTNKSQKTIITTGDFSHLIQKKHQVRGNKQTIDQINFYADLRHDKGSSIMANKSQKQFTIIPFKDRKEFPSFIKKDCVKKLKKMDKEDQQSALDGAHKQNPYTEKIVQNKNFAAIKNFVKVRGRQKISLPSLAWEVGLRNYR